MRALSSIVVLLVVLVGAVGAVVALQGHVGGEDRLRANERASLGGGAAHALSARAVEAFVARAPEPVAPVRRTSSVGARCVADGGGPLRDPWFCEVRYRSGARAHYRVIVQPDGHYRGTGSGIIEGCCVQAPTAE